MSEPDGTGPENGPCRRGHRIQIGSRSIPLPSSPALRIALGVILILAGLAGVLPILGFWMVPLGLFVLSIDLPWARRARRRFAVWFHRRFPALAFKISLGKSKSNLRDGGDCP